MRSCSRNLAVPLAAAVIAMTAALPSTASARTKCRPVAGTNGTGAPDVLTATRTGCSTAQGVSRACLGTACTGINRRTTLIISGRRWRCVTREASFGGSRTTCINVKRIVRFDLYSGE